MNQTRMTALHPRLAGIAAAIALATTLTVTAAPRTQSSSVSGIYEGTCDDLPSEPVYTLDEVATEPAATPIGARGAAVVTTSTSTVDGTLADLLATPHAIAIAHETAIACGDIGGYEVDDELAIGLDEVDDAGFFGVATLHGIDDRTEVVVHLAERAGDREVTPAAGATPAAAAEPVTIALFRFKPTEVHIAAGTTVVWTQTDAVPHTVTAVDGSFTSGSLLKGETFQYTFETPGTYPYVCDFHGSMKATIIVD